MAKRTSRSEPVCTRTPIEAERGVCAGGHPAVADAGVRLMQEGGNAFDALVGAAFTAFVVEPAMCGLGGYARISAYAPGRGGFLSFDAYARAPLAATPDMFDPDASRAPTYYGHPVTAGDRAERGFHAVAVPGGGRRVLRRARDARPPAARAGDGARHRGGAERASRSRGPISSRWPR